MRILIKVLGLTLAFSSTIAMATDSMNASSSGAMHTSSSSGKGAVTKDADNSDLNARDKNGNTLTPQKQTNAQSEIDVLAAVRSAIVDDKNLSMAAHNVKIMVANGAVTLRGPVKSSAEKARVEEISRKIAGVTSVDNRLDIDTH